MRECSRCKKPDEVHFSWNVANGDEYHFCLKCSMALLHKFAQNHPERLKIIRAHAARETLSL